MSEQLAIIREVRFGVGDRGTVVLTFSAYASECSAALQVLNVAEAAAMIKDYGVSDVHDLEGKPCWVNIGGGLMTYARAWKSAS